MQRYEFDRHRSNSRRLNRLRHRFTHLSSNFRSINARKTINKNLLFLLPFAIIFGVFLGYAGYFAANLNIAADFFQKAKPIYTYYPHCAAARALGAAPIHVNEPGYRPELDADRDGIACEPVPWGRD